jgi:hypothetical protein
MEQVICEEDRRRRRMSLDFRTDQARLAREMEREEQEAQQEQEALDRMIRWAEPFWR